MSRDQVLVFDMDGVLVDVSESYRETIVRTVEFFTRQTITRELIQDYKNQGGYNNDWLLSQKICADLGLENTKVELDDKGFIKTGQDIRPDELAEARWPLARAPYLLETSLPAVFAVGDVRCGNVKRVASAVGEGSISIHLVHQTLQE